MDVKLAAAIAGAVRSGEVAAFCRDNRISRQTFYKYRQRFEAHGVAGLESRSRRPLSSPTAVSAGVEDAIVRARKELEDFGTDHGAWSILQRLIDDATVAAVPSQATIWRVLKRRGMIMPEPKKRPRGSFRRFVFPRPNDCWQIDATHYPLANGTTIEIINIIDDHSRLCPASRAVTVCTTINAWETVAEGGARWGLPARILSDNGTQFNQSRRNRRSQFEVNARQAGIVSIASTPYHPQTCGKVERFHQTLKTWLDKQPQRPATTAELQTMLDTFRDYYNTQRPHRSLHGHRPAAIWGAQPHAVPADTPITSTLHLRQQLKVNASGNIRVHRHNANWSINVGVDYAGLTLDVIINTIDCIIFHDRQLVRSLRINPDTYHQASGRKTGGPKHSRLQDSQ